MLAMHAPDGFLEPNVAIATGLIAFVMMSLAVRFAARDLGDRQIPLAGITAAFIFAAQMFNFPVASGTTGHLLGGAMAAILLGPWVGSLVVGVVVITQALVFADGGLTALGYNLVNMAIVPAFGGWAVFWVLRKVLPKNRSGVVGATAIAAGLSVVMASIAFSIQWLFGASAPIPFDTVFGAMVGVHTLIGIGEGLLSAMVVAAVLAARPDLVAGARDLDASQLAEAPRIAARTFVIGAILVASFFAMVVSQFAASDPDGLERVAIDKGFDTSAQDHSLANGIFADYATRGIGNERVSLAIAGITGVFITFLVGAGITIAARQLQRQDL